MLMLMLMLMLLMRIMRLMLMLMLMLLMSVLPTAATGLLQCSCRKAACLLARSNRQCQRRTMLEHLHRKLVPQYRCRL